MQSQKRSVIIAYILYQVLSVSSEYVPKCDIHLPSTVTKDPAVAAIQEKTSLAECKLSISIAMVDFTPSVIPALKYWDEVYCLHSKIQGKQDLATLKPHLLPSLQRIIRDTTGGSRNRYNPRRNFHILASFIEATKIREGYDFLIHELKTYHTETSYYNTADLFDIGFVILNDLGPASKEFQSLPTAVKQILLPNPEYLLLKSLRTNRCLTYKQNSEDGINSSELLTEECEEKSIQSKRGWKLSYVPVPPQKSSSTDDIIIFDRFRNPGSTFLIENQVGQNCTDEANCTKGVLMLDEEKMDNKTRIRYWDDLYEENNGTDVEWISWAKVVLRNDNSIVIIFTGGRRFIEKNKCVLEANWENAENAGSMEMVKLPRNIRGDILREKCTEWVVTVPTTGA